MPTVVVIARIPPSQVQPAVGVITTAPDAPVRITAHVRSDSVLERQFAVGVVSPHFARDVHLASMRILKVLALADERLTFPTDRAPTLQASIYIELTDDEVGLAQRDAQHIHLLLWNPELRSATVLDARVDVLRRVLFIERAPLGVLIVAHSPTPLAPGVTVRESGPSVWGTDLVATTRLPSRLPAVGHRLPERGPE